MRPSLAYINHRRWLLKQSFTVCNTVITHIEECIALPRSDKSNLIFYSQLLK